MHKIDLPGLGHPSRAQADHRQQRSRTEQVRHATTYGKPYRGEARCRRSQGEGPGFLPHNMINRTHQVVWRYSAGLLVPLAFVWGFASIGSKNAVRASVPDSSLVYCLASAHRTELVDAAVALAIATHGTLPDELRLTVDGPSLTPEAWFKARPADFIRACDALIKADAPIAAPSSSSGASKFASLFTVLLPVTVGALLTFLVSEWRAARERAKARSEALRSAMSDLRRTGVEYSRSLTQTSVGSMPSIADFERSRLDLESELTRLQALHRRWNFVSGLRSAIARRIADELQSAPGGDLRARQQKELDVRRLLELIETDVESIALALEAPRFYHRYMWSGRPLSAPAVHQINATGGRP
ncbi:hypothetical protein ABIA31_001141 [Catenulispora sp. MAP5-51]